MRHKSGTEARMNIGFILVEEEVKEDSKDPQELSYIAEYVDQAVVKLNLSLGIIDGVYPTT